MPTYTDRDALYYPYVHVRDVNWLKRTLLIFPHVVRMVPEYMTLNDESEIEKFSRTHGKRGPLLRSANLYSPTVEAAQAALLARVKQDIKGGEDFVQRFGRDAARLATPAGEAGFQLYPRKISYELFRFLMSEQLAWEPDISDGYQYIEMHPRIGEAIMSTLAIACAKDEGLDVVTDDKQKSLNYCLATRDMDSVYDMWVSQHGRKDPPANVKDGQRIMEIIVYEHCDPSKLTPENLARLSDDREALTKFHDALQKLASSIPSTIEDPTVLEERLRSEARDALNAWEKDRANLSALGKQIFDIEGVKNVGDFVGELAKKAATPEVAGSSATGLVAGYLHSGDVLGAAAGFAVGLVVHAASSWNKVRDRAANSPYRYLSMAEKAGVAFTVGT
jgi:hypothetical protein